MVKQKNEKTENLYDFEYDLKKPKKKADNKLSALRKNKKVLKKTEKKKEKTNKSRKIDRDNEIIIGVTKLPEKNIKKSGKAIENKRTSFNNQKTKSKKQVKESLSQRLKKEKRRKKIAKITQILALLIIVFSACIYAMLSPLFNIKEIKITGNEILTNEQILSFSQITIGENIFKIGKFQTEKRLKENSYIENVAIKRKLPGTIEIEIEERVPTMMLLYGNGYVYINNQGYMLEISNEKKELPILIGTSTKNEKFKEGNRLEEEDLNKLGIVLKILNSAQINGFLDILTSIDIENPSNYTLYFESEKKTAYLGNCSNLETRMLYLRKMLTEESGIPGEIFVNMNLNTKDSYFRESV